MTLIFDTSVLIDLQKGVQSTIDAVSRIRPSHPSPPAITFINHFEFIFGLSRCSRKAEADSTIFINHFIIINTTRLTSAILSNLKRKYDVKGLSFSLSDLIIAALAIENNMTLITRDKQFDKIEELSKIIL